MWKAAPCVQICKNGTHMVALQEQPHKPQAVCKSESMVCMLKPKRLPGKSWAPPTAEGWEPASNHEHKGESQSYRSDRWTPSGSHIHELPFHLETRTSSPADTGQGAWGSVLQECRDRPSLVELASLGTGIELKWIGPEVDVASVLPPTVLKGRCVGQSLKLGHHLLELTEFSGSFMKSPGERCSGLSWALLTQAWQHSPCPDVLQAPSFPCRAPLAAAVSPAAHGDPAGRPGQSCNRTETLQTCPDYTSCYGTSVTQLKRH